MDFKQLVLQCRTYRRFTQQPIDPAILDELLENVRNSNSAMNAQVLRFLLVSDRELAARMQDTIHWAGALPPGVGTPKEGEQPTAFVLICKKGKANPWADIDVGICARTMSLNACSYGIGSAMLGAVEWNRVRDILDIPEDWNPRLLLALGYPGCKSTLVEPGEDGSLKYYLDENGGYCVPKLPLSELAIKK